MDSHPRRTGRRFRARARRRGFARRLACSAAFAAALVPLLALAARAATVEESIAAGDSAYVRGDR